MALDFLHIDRLTRKEEKAVLILGAVYMRARAGWQVLRNNKRDQKSIAVSL